MSNISMDYTNDFIINYKGKVIGVFIDWCGTELNDIDECGGWEPISEHCYISDDELSEKEVIEYLDNYYKGAKAK